MKFTMLLKKRKKRMTSKTLIDLIKEAIGEDLHLTINETDSSILIEETQAQAECRFVKIKLKKSVPYFGFSLEKLKKEGRNDPIYPFFNPKIKGICSKNDAILCVQKSTKIYVLLIEMKSTNIKGYLEQLKAAKVFVEFVLQRLKIFHQEINTKVEFRGLLFRHRRIQRDGVSYKKQKMKFEDRNGLLVTENQGNRTYHLQQFL